MDYTKQLDKIYKELLKLEQRLSTLLKAEGRSHLFMLMTRQEAAKFMGVSLRQFDRRCHDLNIEKVHTPKGVRIRKCDLLVRCNLMTEFELDHLAHMRPTKQAQNDFDKILARRMRQ